MGVADAVNEAPMNASAFAEETEDGEPVCISSVEATPWRLIKFDISGPVQMAETAAGHGLSPEMARVCLCRLMAESFCERIISHGGLASADKTTAADAEHAGDRCVCHMNEQHKGKPKTK